MRNEIAQGKAHHAESQGLGQGFGIWDLEGYFAKMKLYATVMTVFGLLSVFACAGTQSGGTGTKDDAALITPQRLKDIAGIEWHLTKMEMADKSISLVENSKTTFSCDEDGKVAGVATINRYFGNFNLKENGDIVWNKAFGMTRMAGPPELMEQEAAFMQALPQTAQLYLKASKLILISKDEFTTLEFAKIDN